MDRALEILVAEDHYADFRYFQLVLAEIGIPARLHRTSDGEETVAFFLRRAPHTSAPRPDIAFIDLNMPKMNGIEVLDAIGGVGEWPVCMLTGSMLERDEVLRHLGLDIHCYLVKPVDPEKLRDCFRSFEHLKSYVNSA